LTVMGAESGCWTRGQPEEEVNGDAEAITAA
jgi:hypothetical protein